MVVIRDRYTSEPIYSADVGTAKEAVEQANLSGSNLRGSDLRDSDLRGSDLRGSNLSDSNLRGSDLRDSDLRGSNLSGSDLSGSNLRGSDLSDSNLRGSDLRGSDLRDSNLRGSGLRGSNLSDAKLNWRSHDLISEILRQAADGDTEKLKIAGLLLVQRNKCWYYFLGLDDPLTDWALGVLLPWAKGDDNAPNVLKQKLESEGA